MFSMIDFDHSYFSCGAIVFFFSFLYVLKVRLKMRFTLRFNRKLSLLCLQNDFSDGNFCNGKQEKKKRHA